MGACFSVTSVTQWFNFIWRVCRSQVETIPVHPAAGGCPAMQIRLESRRRSSSVTVLAPPECRQISCSRLHEFRRPRYHCRHRFHCGLFSRGDPDALAAVRAGGARPRLEPDEDPRRHGVRRVGARGPHQPARASPSPGLDSSSTSGWAAFSLADRRLPDRDRAVLFLAAVAGPGHLPPSPARQPAPAQRGLRARARSQPLGRGTEGQPAGLDAGQRLDGDERVVPDADAVALRGFPADLSFRRAVRVARVRAAERHPRGRRRWRA